MHRSVYYTEWTDEGPSVVERVIIGSVAYDIPYESYAGPGVEDRTDRWDYVPETSLNDVADEPPSDFTDERSAQPFPVITGAVYDRNAAGDIRARCAKGCGWTLHWGGYAGDVEDFTIATMVHAYAHQRDFRSKR